MITTAEQTHRRAYLTPEECAAENEKGFVHLCREVRRMARASNITVTSNEAKLVARTVFVQRQLVADGEAGASLAHSDETGELAVYRQLQVIATEHRS
ncbi:hypothetical protein [Rhodococcus phage REQ1]|uniref:hypothetical protein n=1 Tax=Rhodococcus phage REQ1 TaxID=1109712 RepID=UPI00023EEBFA|nr:hypothetical protein RoPhREQ1_gp25 [Rhodococcus phage REQ1]AEV52021.1 hypothetical protein [Rhodococcus phage REQ1]